MWSPLVSWRASQPAAPLAGSVVSTAAAAGVGTATTAADTRASSGNASRRARDFAIRGYTFRPGPRRGTRWPWCPRTPGGIVDHAARAPSRRPRREWWSGAWIVGIRARRHHGGLPLRVSAGLGPDFPHEQ